MQHPLISLLLLLSLCACGQAPSTTPSAAAAGDIEEGDRPLDGSEVPPADTAAGRDEDRSQVLVLHAWDGWRLTFQGQQVKELIRVVSDAKWRDAEPEARFAFPDYHVELPTRAESSVTLEVYMPGRRDGVEAHARLGEAVLSGISSESASAFDDLAAVIRSLREASPLGDDLPDENAVLAKGDVFEIRNEHGTLGITANSNRKRTFTWDGASRSVFMKSRKTPWYGGMGLYWPGPGDHWEDHKGVTRAVITEEQRDFVDEAEFRAWLADQEEWYDAKYTLDGIIAGWSINNERNQLNVEVWRITVGGERPTELEGGTSDWLTWTHE